MIKRCVDVMSWRCTAFIEPFIRHVTCRMFQSCLLSNKPLCEKSVFELSQRAVFSPNVFFVLVIAGVVRHVAVTDTKIAEETTADEEMRVDGIMMIDVALTRLLLLRSSIPEKTIFR